VLSPGVSPDSMGSYVEWSTSEYEFSGHSECFELCRVAPAFGTNFWPAQHEDIVSGLQSRFHLFLDHLRAMLLLPGHKEHYHISMRRD
jgi:hypothetical protein